MAPNPSASMASKISSACSVLTCDCRSLIRWDGAASLSSSYSRIFSWASSNTILQAVLLDGSPGLRWRAMASTPWLATSCTRCSRQCTVYCCWHSANSISRNAPSVSSGMCPHSGRSLIPRHFASRADHWTIKVVR
ncbi:unnamed protein product [Chrysoparadoxa australica]